MPRRPERPVLPGDPLDPEGASALIHAYLEGLRVRNYSERSVANNQQYLLAFFAWAGERGLTRSAEVTRTVVERYRRWLFHLRQPDGRPLSVRAQYSRLGPLRTFFRQLVRGHHLLYSPAAELELPKLEQRLPRCVLTAAEAEAVLAQAEVTTPRGLRDRTLLETLYSTGVRRAELAALAVYDLEPERGTLMVRLGKGKKDRVVPIGERALAWVAKYLDEARPALVREPDPGTLFLTDHGRPFALHRLTRLVRGYVEGAALGKRGACHLFRHTAATLMLENGADIRFIQELLGHARLSTTQVYTKVSIAKLKEVHARTHPAARLLGRDGESPQGQPVEGSPAGW